MIPAQTLALYEKLNLELPDQFARDVLRGTMRVAWDDSNPIRINLFAAGLRELVSYILYEAAPDEEVRKCSWFREDPNLKAKREAESSDTKPRITRAQRMMYATQGGLPDQTLREIGIDVKETHRQLSGVFDRLNKLTHVRPGSRIDAAEDVIKFMDEAFSGVIAFYSTLSSCRTEVISSVTEAIDESALNSLTETVIQELDELSTHTFIEEVEIYDVRVASMRSDVILFEATGTVFVTLNYGSRSDFARGDGATMDDKYPFSLILEAPTSNIHKLKAGHPSVDNSSFYE